MGSRKALSLLICVFACISLSEAACKNKLKKNGGTITINNGTRYEVVLKRCITLAKSFPVLCDSKYGYGNYNAVCCKACKGVNTSCVDDITIWTDSTGDQSNCKKYIKEDPCRCENATIKAICCASCMQIATPAKLAKLRCDCRDSVSKNSPVNITNTDGSVIEVVTSCKTIASKYQKFCSPAYLGVRCCRSCEKVDTSCVDDITIWTDSMGDQSNCKKYIKEDPCRCENATIKAICCASCMQIATPAKLAKLRCNCRDSISENSPVNITNTDGSVIEVVTSCKTIAYKYQKFCSPAYLGVRCCRSCENVDYNCTDNVRKNNPVTVTKKDADGNVIKVIIVTSCKKLVKLFPSFCNQGYGGPGNNCCKSCPP